MENYNEYIRQNASRFLSELKTLLAIPSISTDERYKPDMLHCANEIKSLLLDAGCDQAEVYQADHHPVVLGQKIVDKKLPTVLVYGHYDVQPPDPRELWHSDPFDAQIKDGKITARGASDDKGQLFIHIKALEMLTKTGGLPCNMKFLIEGEEEIGSPSLPGFLEQYKEALSADVVLVSDTAMISMENPSIEVSLRGLVYMELEVTGPDRDLHSGVYGGAVANPVTILCQLLGSLHDKDNHVAIPGFYDKVEEATEDERQAIRLAPFDVEAYKKDLGVKELWGEKGFSTLERVGIRPTLDINGIWGGYTGEGAKTVLPSKACAKVSMRLVAGQAPGEIAAFLKSHLLTAAPQGVEIKMRILNTGEPVTTDTRSKGFVAAEKAIKKVLGKEPYKVHSGGSIPVVALFKDILKLDTVLLGFGLDSDNIHSPNEKLDIINFVQGIETVGYFHEYYSK